MVLTRGKNLGNAVTAPDFALPEPLTGKTVTLADVRGNKGTLVIFMCNHCPFVVHITSGLVEAGRKAKSLDIGVVGISANDAVTYPADGPQEIKKMAASTFTTFPYLYDEKQTVAKEYGAVCTPEFFLFDSDDKLFYHGQFDDSRPGNGKSMDGKSLFDAFNALVEGDPAISDPTPSIGCSIKWCS